MATTDDTDTKRQLTVHTTIYGPWEDGADEREKLDTKTETFTIERDPGQTWVQAVAQELDWHGLDQYSASEHQANGSGWFTAEPYEHPYKGTLEEVSAVLEGLTPEQDRAVYDRVILNKHTPSPKLRMLTDSQARVAAAHWQSPGDNPAIAVLQSTGRISRHTEDQVITELRRCSVQGSLERQELSELLNYIRASGVRSDQPGWDQRWDDEYESEQKPGATLIRRDEQGQQVSVVTFATPDDALKALHKAHGYSASHALQYEGYELQDAHGESLNDRFISREHPSTRPTSGKWQRSQIDYLAESLSRLPESESEKLGHYFASDLAGSNRNFDQSRFVTAVTTENYQGNTGNASPHFGRNRVAYLADMVKHYPGDKHALGHQIADSLTGVERIFDREYFLSASDVEPFRISIPPTHANGEYAVRVRQGSNGTPFDVHFDSPELAKQARAAYQERGWDAEIQDLHDDVVMVSASEIEVGDQFRTDGAFVTEVHHDDDGTWVTTDDGDEGYLGKHGKHGVVRPTTDQHDDVIERLRQVERGELPSGSVIAKVTGPNSMLTPGNSQTSEDGPRDAGHHLERDSNMSAETTTFSGGEVTGLVSSIDKAKQLVDFLGETGTALEQFEASLSSAELTGQVLDHLGSTREHISAAKSSAEGVHAELNSRMGVKEASDAVDGQVGTQDFISGE